MSFLDFLCKKKQSENDSIAPFCFHSSQHQRYENDTPVMGLQICSRSFTIEKNTNGCEGYQLKKNYGNIIYGTNDETGKPQFSPKPMVVKKEKENYVLLQGYPTQAMSPFGWMDLDLSDYGFEIFYNNGEVEKCVLHLYDRNTRIEYLK